MKDLRSNRFNRWITLAVLGFSGGIAYQLPYLRYTYHDAMLASFGFDNTQLGGLVSIFGLVAVFLYAPGGMLADRFSHRKLITTSIVLSGLVGFVFATYPPFWLCLVIEMIWAFTTVLLLSSPMIKATSMLGTRAEQGKLLGWLEGFSGVGGMLVAFFTMWVFSKLGARAQDLTTVINIYSVLYVLLGI
ncbi:MAG TPA: MFS transporter, partial [Negativicutes bacterium]